MRQHLEQLFKQALQALQSQGVLPDLPTTIEIGPTKDPRHGDLASNVALILAKSTSLKPRELAERIVAVFPVSPFVSHIEIAGPGFINLSLSARSFQDLLSRIHQEKAHFGECVIGRKKRVLVEFVSSNPTGPLHVGHGRHAAFGDVLCRLLSAIGFDVSSEYYVNDAGRQMDILAVSIWVRYLALHGVEMPFPMNAYRGDYVIDVAKQLKKEKGEALLVRDLGWLSDLPKDEHEGGDKEIYIDALIQYAKQRLSQHYMTLFDAGLNSMLADIKNDLTAFGVLFNDWFSERSFVTAGAVDHALEQLKTRGYTEERDGALWFLSTQFGDEKDRVLIRSNGERTYFANDIAYHLNKFERGFDLAIDIFGADHHGYMARVRGAISALGVDPERLIYLLGQFVTLYRGGQPVSMSTRGGDFVTLRELREEVGNDAARFFYVMRKYDQHIDFDLDLAKSQSNDNPVYYVQYAYARICSVLLALKTKNLCYDEAQGLLHIGRLSEPEERQLLNALMRYPTTVMNAALQYEPHILTNYMREVAACFHAYYNAHPFLVEDEALRNARLVLVLAVRQVLLNGFKLLGITAPEKM
jgi:arginyl-tRNA synthetase